MSNKYQIRCMQVSRLPVDVDGEYEWTGQSSRCMWYPNDPHKSICVCRNRSLRCKAAAATKCRYGHTEHLNKNGCPACD